ncbi:MAG TPA: T9SS type A sorting domain-containing protein, partial [Bacteroidales bacterium]|nr:T9SS type A sorting domain-containing protein [Bacteroidales bacterium]
NTNCSWLIKPFDSIQNIKLTFLKLDLPDPSDVIKIYKGDDNNGILIATFTGTNIPNAITVNSKSVFIEFLSNDSIQGDGFLLSYSTTLYNFCTANLVQIVADSGVVNDCSDIYNYHNTRICRWRITPENANNLLLTFNYFDIDSTDYLTIKSYDGNVNLELRGNSLPSPINISSFPINIMFSSSNTYNAQGFELVFKPDINAIDTFNDDSYIYPNPFNDFLNLKTDNNGQLFIYSPEGQLIYSQNFYSGNNIINTANWSAGIYFVIFVNNDLVFSKKIIKIYE